MSDEVPAGSASTGREAVARRLYRAVPRISRTATRQLFAIYPDLTMRQPQRSVETLRRETEEHLLALAEAVDRDDPASFGAYIQAVVGESVNRADDGEGLVKLLEIIGQLIRELLGEDVWSLAEPVLDRGVEIVLPDDTVSMRHRMPDTHKMTDLYVSSILNGRRLRAQSLVLDALHSGLSIRQVYLDVFQPALYEIGSLWERGQISIAKEHLATAITQSILSRVYADVSLDIRDEQSAIVACLAGNQHEIGPRMLADFLQMAQFNTRFLGANTPLHSLIEYIDEVKPDVIGLPASTEDHVLAVRDAIGHLRADFSSYRPIIMVGGLAFNIEDGLWRQVGGDVWGIDAGAAIDSLVGNTAWS